MTDYYETAETIFANRTDAGRKLGAALAEFRGERNVVLAIPNGAVSIAVEVALALEAELDLVISRKVPLPLEPEGGFGAVTDDGTVILNDDLVKRYKLTAGQIDELVTRVRRDIRQRSLLYRKDRALTLVNGKNVIIVDDGLASGYTMLAAVAAARRRRPRQVVVAVPVSSKPALEAVAKVADKVVTLAVGTAPRFFISDFYGHWHDPTDKDVLGCLESFQATQHVMAPRVKLRQPRW